MNEPSFRVLVTDEVDPEGVALLRAEPRIHLDEEPTLPPERLLEIIPRYDALVGRSATRISRDLLEAGSRLKVIGRAGVGVDNVEIERATELGIGVINAPAGNTVAVAELVFAVALALLRKVTDAHRSMRDGEWRRSALGGSELRGRTLSVVGLGRIGTEVTRRARAFGMKVVAFDPYVVPSRFEELGAERADTLEDALSRADILTLHVPLTSQTRGMIGPAEIGRLGPGAFLLNYARGGIVDEAALVEALRAGRLAGAGVDVFAREPLAADHPLRAAPNTILTPHLGASTAEAQKSVAIEACAAVRNALLTGDVSAALNASGVGGAGWGELRPLFDLSERLGRLGRALLPGGLTALELRYSGHREDAPRALLLAALQGSLRNVVDRRAINLVNAQHVAQERGIETIWAHVAPQHELGEEIELRLEGGDRGLRITGALLGETHGRITRIGAFRVDIAPRGTLIVLRNRDVPGVIGHVGTLLGDTGVNIAEYHQARLRAGGEALAAVSIDQELGAAALERLASLPDVLEARQVVME